MSAVQAFGSSLATTLDAIPTGLECEQADTEIPRTCWQFPVVAVPDCYQHEDNQETQSTMRNTTEHLDNDKPEPFDSAALSIEMLKAVVDGETYEEVAARFNKSRTAVERRIKTLAAHLTKVVGVQGLNEEGTAFVRRLRNHRKAILAALEVFDPYIAAQAQEPRVLSEQDIELAVSRIKRRSSRSWHDIALFYLLFATGARPLEIARLEIRDYLDADGGIRRKSLMRSEVAINGRSRALYFASSHLDEALANYLQERLAQNLGVHQEEAFGGFDPMSRLFLSATGEGFKIIPYLEKGKTRYLCRPILETYDKLFRYAEIKDVSARSSRRTVAARLHARGADLQQIGLLLGISETSAVRALLPKPKPSLSDLVDELV